MESAELTRTPSCASRQVVAAVDAPVRFHRVAPLAESIDVAPQRTLRHFGAFGELAGVSGIGRHRGTDRLDESDYRRSDGGSLSFWRLLRNSVYAGRALFNHMEALPPSGRSQHSTRHRLRPRDDWISITVPSIISDEVFEAAQQVSRDHSAFSPRNTTAECWLLRRLVRCGRCHLSTECRQMRDRHGVARRYYRCQNHDQYRAGSEERRCQERSIRADQLDAFVFGQVREALLRHDVLLAGERAVASRTPTPDDELLTAQLQSLDRKLEHSEAERRRLLDVYQTGLVELTEFQRRIGELDLRRRQLTVQKETLVTQRYELAQNNRLRQRVGAFAERIRDGLDELTFQQRQRLLRLVVEQERVQGWQVEIRLRIPLDDPSDGEPVPLQALLRKGAPLGQTHATDNGEPEALILSDEARQTLAWIEALGEE